MFAGMTKSMGGNAEPEGPSFNLGSTGTKFNLVANKLANGEMPTLTEESAFSKCLPNLTFKQVCHIIHHHYHVHADQTDHNN
jgi:hypothetical protein